MDELAAIEAKTGFFPGAGLPGLRRGYRRRLRVLSGEASFHHVMSRQTDGLPFWSDVEKEALCRILRRMARFCGLDLLAMCVMGNHFHALVRVPDRAQWLARFDGPEGEARFFAHLGVIYSRKYVAHLRAEIDRLRQDGRDGDAEAVLAAFRRRFCDAGVWAKEVKARFAHWMNRRSGRRGVLWMGRFKDVLVEDGEALRTMACYIDLNPVRAGLVGDPAAYRWSSYGQACAGSPAARASMATLASHGGLEGVGWAEVSATYRTWLELAARRRPTTDQPAADGLRRAALPLASALAGRLRYFTDALAVGGREWVERLFVLNRDHFSLRRRHGARRMRGIETGLRTLRDLQVRVRDG